MSNITIKEYPTNIQIFINGDCYDINTDGWIDNSCNDNIDYVIEKLEEYVYLMSEEKKYIRENIHSYAYAHSIDVYK